MSGVRIGHGYDVHAFAQGEGFVLGGVWFACDKSVVAHSDGDVLIHALCDALLGALGRGDIGRLFPDQDVDNANRDSREFLRRVVGMADDDGYQLGNADITVIAQAPRIATRVREIRQSLAKELGCAETRLNIKATTTEKLGFLGREEGIAAEAVVLLESRS